MTRGGDGVTLVDLTDLQNWQSVESFDLLPTGTMPLGNYEAMVNRNAAFDLTWYANSLLSQFADMDRNGGISLETICGVCGYDTTITSTSDNPIDLTQYEQVSYFAAIGFTDDGGIIINPLDSSLIGGEGSDEGWEIYNVWEPLKDQDAYDYIFLCIGVGADIYIAEILSDDADPETGSVTMTFPDGIALIKLLRKI